MPSEFDSAKAYAKELEQANSQRNEMYRAMDALYWMDWAEEAAVKKQLDNIKITRSPRARNAILGAKRLLTATDPIISIPYDINNAFAKDRSDKIEKFCKAMFFASGRYAGTPIHYDAVHSGLLYSDVVIGVDSVADLIEHASQNTPAIIARLEEIQNRTPYLFKIYNPKGCYVERDVIGVVAFYRKVETTVGAIEDNWGENGLKALRSHKDRKELVRNHTVTLNDYFDLKNRFLWMDNYDNPILEIEHGLPCIPVACGIAEGSTLFDLPEEQREPFLYTAWKSGIIDRESLILTYLYTMTFAIGANPMFVDYLQNPDDPHKVDYSVPGGTIHYRVGEKREIMTKNVIDPSMMEAWNIANELEMQSTLYRQALGEPVSSSTPYSSYALMSQSGRLPLIATQKMVGNVLAESLEIALRWMKKDGQKAVARYEKLSAEISPEDIDKTIDIKVQLEIELPQDRLQMANAANMLTQGEKPLMPQRWAREKILGEGQNADITREIWDEDTAAMFKKKYDLQKLMEIQQLEQMAMMPPNQTGSGMPGSTDMAQAPGGGAGTPAQPNLPPGAQPIEPREPYPSLSPTPQPMEGA